MKSRYLRGWANSDPLAVSLRAMLQCTSVITRVGNLFPGITSRIPSGPYGGDLSAIAHARAVELWERYDEILVLWSGGTDSTLATALLAHYRNGKRLMVSLSGRAETGTGPEAYQWLVDQGCEFIEASPAAMRQVVDEGGMVVTGHHADSLLLGEYADIGEAIWDMTLVEAVVAKTGFTPAWAEKLIADAQPFFDYLEIEHTVPNLCWWMDFAACWDAEEMSFFVMYHLKPPGEGYVTFYGSDAFQRWAVQPVEDKVGRGGKAFKYRLHEIIEGVMGFKPTLVHRNNDLIETELHSLLSSAFAIQEDWQVIA